MPARAQQPDEVIEDPELSAVPGIQPEAPAAADPDPDPDPVPVVAPPPSEPPASELRAVLRSRIGIDLRFQDPREEVLEATQLGLLEARVRTSPCVAFALGLRLRHFTGVREHSTPEADAARYTLDAAPTAGYAELTLDAADSLHLRLGWQSVALGRFDALEPSDVLSASDLRSGPTTLPEGAELAQPAARLDWDPTRWLSLRALALPFFTPHLVYGYTGDYALAPADSDASNALLTALAPNAQDAARLSRVLRGFSRSGQSAFAEGSLSAFAPQPSLAQPQGALRAVAHAPNGELGVTLATALERLPAVHPSRALLDYLDDASAANLDALAADDEPLGVRYGRLGLLSFDAGTELGPLSVGAEVAYGLHRTLLAATPGGPALPESTDVLYAGLRAERVSGEALLLAVEVLGARALEAPSQPGARYLFLRGGRHLLAVAAFAAYRVLSIGLSFELGVGALNGPSYVFAPRVEQELGAGLYVEAGAYVVGGKQRPPGAAGVTLGGLYDDVDQAFLGLRWLL